METKQVKDERLHLYSTKAIGVVTVAELLDTAQYERGSIWAHVENSGSEGWYVEVARWHQGKTCHQGEWRRYAHQKYLGGEFEGKTDYECAGYVAQAINSFHDADPNVVFCMPDWTKETV